ncbi:hypothetical protein SAMN05192575_101871 [Nocardioides alpinus]|uniref:Uncharacterized protein n=1 Tax=Nocardioides alpinus TaxID=748909 RepID=A0A1I0WCN9_9ACTN|nr:hypothetical protein [Nocardioides alpinus]PKH37818.1 hypothetical protein CXG46_20705 [Nocardioides alpinus]SFA86028.1 hypothetical protein SAMN05192575_101871 [Nocardioides alpinus]
MTRVLVDKIEVQQDGLAFGDPIGCGYHWTEPDEVDAYGDSVRRLAGKVELAVDGFERTATLPEEVFAGEAADALRTRAAKRHEEAVLVRDNLRGLGRAINAYSDVLRRHREGLEQLHARATGQGLDVRGQKIWPPVETIPGDAPQKELDAWERDWKAYQECFETKIELRDARRVATRELIRALADYADVHPDKDRQKLVAASAHQVTFGELRREAAEEAMEAVQAGDHAEAAQRTVDGLKRREQSALGSLEDMVLAERPPAEIQAQAEKVAAIHRELTEARVDAREAQVVADREQAQANRAARHLEDAESGKPRLVAEPVAWQQPTDQAVPVNLKDRLG